MASPSAALYALTHRSLQNSIKFSHTKQCPSTTSLAFGKRNVCSLRTSRLEVRCSENGASKSMAVVDSCDVCFQEQFPLRWTDTVEGKIFVKLDSEEDGARKLTLGCNLPGKWILHWGVNYVDDVGSEWDQPPVEIIPPESITIKAYAVETPLKKVAKEDHLYELTINVVPDSGIASINFVLKDEETGAWYQHKGRDFKVPLLDDSLIGKNIIGFDTGSDIGGVGDLPNIMMNSEMVDTKWQTKQAGRFYEEYSIVKESLVDNSVTISVRKYPQTLEYLLEMETDLPGEVVVHWGVCMNDSRNWQVPEGQYPPNTTIFKKKALRTLLQPREGGNVSSEMFTLNLDTAGFVFVLKQNENRWFKYNGDDFFVPLLSTETKPERFEEQKDTSYKEEPPLFTDKILKEITHMVTVIATDKSQLTKSKETQEIILQEIEKLAAEAYSIFRTSTPALIPEEADQESKAEKLPRIRSATGTGYEILCQGFNWESHKSGKWYVELKEKAAELSSLGITVMWLPPPTESVSPEGYMPRDLYNLNSRYGTIDELKDLVNTLHGVGIKVLGDAVLNHRCAHYQNKNGVWNIFGGRLNWDDRAVVADDPHFQGRGNKSSGDCFHAAPNIDHSQDFVRRDINEWLLWLRDEIGYDGWRLDFVRGFWGGYVKDYMESSKPYFSVGEFWDSLSYSYGEMDHNQDAHRQRIVDWINATSGTCGAFDVTTKGILHAALEKCEYWRLCDEKGKPPGVLGWWPSRAITFIENHDTGSTQGHWRFPGGKEMQGYAYILTHPGTPSVFYDHIFSHCHSEIKELISLRNRSKINCRSTVKITKTERDVYAAVIDEKVAMKIGPGHYEPHGEWSLCMEGRDYKIWETS